MAIIDLTTEKGFEVNNVTIAMNGNAWGIVDPLASNVFSGTTLCTPNDSTLNISILNNQLCVICGANKMYFPSTTGYNYILNWKDTLSWKPAFNNYVIGNWTYDVGTSDVGGVLLIADSTGIKTYVGDDIKGKSPVVGGYITFPIVDKE